MQSSNIEFLTDSDVWRSGYMDSIAYHDRHEPEDHLDEEYEHEVLHAHEVHTARRRHRNKRTDRQARHKRSRTNNHTVQRNDSPTLTKYVKATKLTDDFRHLVSPIAGTPKPPPVLDYCPVCLEGPHEPRTLPCHHTYCRVCLQYMIDREAPQSDSDRGFLCKMCNFFVKVPNYTVPRSEWADQLELEEYKFLTSVTKPGPDVPGIEPRAKDSPNLHQPRPTDKWTIEWRISAFPKSYIIDNDLDPTKRTLHRFERHTGHDSDEDDDDDRGNGSIDDDVEAIRRVKWASRDEHLDDSGDADDDEFEDDRDMLIRVSEEMKAQGTDKTRRVSKIIAAAFYEDRLIIYDEEFCELTIYNNDLTVQSTVRQLAVHSLGVLDNLLFMTIPDDRTIEILDLDNLQQRPSIKLTLQCYGISALEDRLAVLLSENEEKPIFHVSFLDENGIIGGRIPLKDGYLSLECPRHLAVCPLTRLLFVSDTKKGLVKCYRMDGRLCWEKIVVDAGALATYNGDVIVARRFTNSIDVLTGGGMFNGRLESEQYSIFLPTVIAVNNNDSNILVVDAQQLIHMFELIKNPSKTPEPEVAKNSCSCIVL